MSGLLLVEQDIQLAPGQRVEWRNGTGGAVARGRLVSPDNGLGGPWWLVDVDGEDKPILVKPYVLYPEGGIRRERTADAIHQVMRMQAIRRTGVPDARWSDALACADAVIAMDDQPTW